MSKLSHALRAKAVLCPGLRVTLTDEKKKEKTEWYYEDGISDYLADATIDFQVIPETPFTSHFEGDTCCCGVGDSMATRGWRRGCRVLC
jgi:topoisomerase-4 subunit B